MLWSHLAKPSRLGSARYVRIYEALVVVSNSREWSHSLRSEIDIFLKGREGKEEEEVRSRKEANHHLAGCWIAKLVVEHIVILDKLQAYVDS